MVLAQYMVFHCLTSARKASDLCAGGAECVCWWGLRLVCAWVTMTFRSTVQPTLVRSTLAWCSTRPRAARRAMQAPSLWTADTLAPYHWTACVNLIKALLAGRALLQVRVIISWWQKSCRVHNICKKKGMMRLKDPGIKGLLKHHR